MATKKIWELPAASTLNDTDVIVIDDGSNNYKIPWGTVKGLLGSVSAFEADPDQTTYPGRLRLTLANGTVLRAYCADPAKQNLLTFDNAPTAGSNNPVKSGGIKSALDLKLDSADYVNFTGAGDQNPGTAGKVPAPAAGGERYLSSSGAWTVPDAAPTAGSGKPVSSGGVKDAIDGAVKTLARPNLLDNWYFGPGVINQRIRTSGDVSKNMFAVDRWRGYYTGGFSFEILSDCVRFTTSSTLNRWIVQTPRSGETYFPAGDYTLSVLIKNLSVGEDQHATLWMVSAFSGTAVSGGSLQFETAGLVTFSFTIAANQARAVALTIPKKANSDSANNYADVVAFKLEKGDTQTLAHQENGAWVLNEIPEPETERLKCQRFFQIFSAESLIPKVGNTAYGMDFRPPMLTDTVTTDTLQVDGVTYYTASSEPSLS